MSKIAVAQRLKSAVHTDAVYSLEKGPSASEFFSSGGDGRVVRWNVEEPDKAKLVAKVDSSIYAMRYIPELDTLVVAQNHEGIHVIQCSTKKILGSLKLAATAFFSIEFYKGFLYVACGDGSLLKVNLQKLVVEKVKQLSDASVRSLAIHPVEERMVCGTSDNNIYVVDLKNFTIINQLQGHTNSVFSTTFSPNGRYLLSAGRDAHLKVWDVTKNWQLQEDIIAHMYAINAIAYHANGKFFVTGSMDKSIKLWDAQTFRLLKVIDKARHAGHGTSVNKVLWLSFQNQMISCSDDRSVATWDIKLDY